jgi:hypothetical protein
MIPTTSAGDVQVTCITMTKQMSAQPKKWYRANKTKISGASEDRRMGPLASTERSLMETGAFIRFHSRTSHWVELLASTERSLMDSRGVPSSVL